MAQPALTKSRFGHIRCLLIEDSEFDQRNIKRVLDGLGIERLDIVTTVGHARAHLMRHRVDLILLDNGLPDGFGVDFALELKQHPRLTNIPVVIVSDWPTPFMFDKALIARVRQVLRKDEFNLARAADVLRFSRRGLATKPSTDHQARQ
jgi:CheY-like chemotaxis protein